MGTLNSVSISCGVKQLYHLTGHPIEDVGSVIAYLETFNNDNGWLVIFSDNQTRGRGEKLANFIRQRRLGKIVEIGYARNPNTHYSRINAWIWRVNQKACRKLLKGGN